MHECGIGREYELVAEGFDGSGPDGSVVAQDQLRVSGGALVSQGGGAVGWGSDCGSTLWPLGTGGNGAELERSDLEAGRRFVKQHVAFDDHGVVELP